MSAVTRYNVIGPGRVGGGLIDALEPESRWHLVRTYRRGDDPADAADDVDVVVIAVPDDHIGDVAARVRPTEAVVVHMAGAKALSALAPHRRVGSLHPLTSLADRASAGRQLRSGIMFAVAGDPVVTRLAVTLGGHPVHVPDELRIRYHATAAVAANHLVALCGQVERLAHSVGVPVDRYWDLMAQSLGNVRSLGPRAALTGPAARGDRTTIDAHLADLPPTERPLYRALADEARNLTERQSPQSDIETTESGN